jgi:pimeloyl-ACP methyl ester carboxylesterase
MTHGFSATRHTCADKYAEIFCKAGLTILLYDHLGFGDSGGEPRRQLDPWIQARGYRDAISYGSNLEGVDASLIALWGHGFSAGVALAVAAVDESVAAMVAQVPALGRELPPADPDGSLYRAFKETILSGAAKPSEGEIQGPMPVVSDDQVRRPSALQPGASRGASPTPSSGASWRIRRRLLAAPLDKEEPRTPYLRTSRNTPSTHSAE